MSQTETGWLHHRRGAFHKSLHGEVRTLQPLSPNSTHSNDSLPFKIVGYSLPCERHPQRNEDSLLIDEHTGLIAVYDGVGGSAAGDIASLAARRATLSGWKSALGQIYKRRSLHSFLNECDKVDLCTLLQHLIELADETIRT
ncbi:MAG: hypothetical protein ACXVCM_15945, partial [Ktedonobacteraceae bacterium]